MAFDPAFPVSELKAASYNPRKIGHEQRERLKHSIALLGFAKPVIVLSDGLTIAGHQRGNAARELGLDAVPAYVLPAINAADEVRFNQMHNGTDLDDCDPMPSISTAVRAGFQDVPACDISGNLRATGVALRGPMMRLLLKYGNWGGAVALPDGEVMSGGNYLLACKQLGMTARVYGVAASTRGDAITLLRAQYGQFSYDHIERTTWRQSFAQMNRLSGTRGKSQQQSTLYRTWLLPDMRPGDRTLDFGSGRGAYPRRARILGHDLVDVEFYRKARGTNNLDKTAVHAMIDKLITSLRSGGLMDRVVCEAVLNSVDTVQAETDVMRCVSAFLKPGGVCYISGRSREIYNNYAKATIAAASSADWNAVAFMDDDGIMGTHTYGGWFFQKLHSKPEADQLIGKYIGPATRSYHQLGAWMRMAVKSVEHPQGLLEQSIRREFDLPWPDGTSVNRADDVLAAWRLAAGQ